MVDEGINPRTVESMKNFSNYSKSAKENMQALQQQMDKFTKSMAMTKSNTVDLTKSLKDMSNTQPMQQATGDTAIPTAAGGASQETNVIVNLKIDVSGVTDKTDKRALAKEISAMVTKELKSKIGGSLTQSGFNRSG
jgi:ABC-type transporter Mla subunit MlaD